MRAYSQDLRDKVINKYKEGVMKMTDISKLFGICYESVRDWVRRYQLLSAKADSLVNACKAD